MVVHPSILYSVCSGAEQTNLLTKTTPIAFVKRADPPVKAIISVRRQVLLQFIVGLLYFPTEVLELTIQRVLQAGRVVTAVHDPREPTAGWKRPTSVGEQNAAGPEHQTKTPCSVASFNGICSQSCSVVLSAQKRQTFCGRIQKAPRGRGNARSSCQGQESRGCGGSVPRTEMRNGRRAHQIYRMQSTQIHHNVGDWKL